MSSSVPPTRLKLALFDSQGASELRIVAAHLLDEPRRVFTPDEYLERVTEWEVGRESVVDDGVDNHGGSPYGMT